MDVPINYLAVLLAAVASMGVGFVWYSPLLFSKPWMKEMGLTEKKMETAGKEMGKTYLMTFVGSLAMAYVLAHSLVFAGSYLKLSGVSAGLQAGFWSWFGFIAPVQMTTVLFGGKSWKFYWITAGHQLASILVMGIVLGLMS